jgi:transcriptional regulator GlxA family with amidase domain
MRYRLRSTGAVYGLALLAAGFLASQSVRAGDEAPKKKTNWKVAIVLYNRVELLDFAGPGEVFAAAGQGRFKVFTVAGSKRPILSQGFLTVEPKYSIDDCPKPDIVVIPGGDSSVLRKDKKMMEWLQTTAKDADLVMSVCTGAFALADLGLLDGKEATTHWSGIKMLKKRYPKINVRNDQRIVDTGRTVTTAGVSAGIDGALYVVSKLCGMDTARRTARYMEYNWDEKLSPSLSGDRTSAP